MLVHSQAVQALAGQGSRGTSSPRDSACCSPVFHCAAPSIILSFPSAENQGRHCDTGEGARQGERGQGGGGRSRGERQGEWRGSMGWVGGVGREWGEMLWKGARG